MEKNSVVRIKIEDLPLLKELSEEEMANVVGGRRFGGSESDDDSPIVIN